LQSEPQPLGATALPALRSVIAGLKPIMEIAITITAAPAPENTHSSSPEDGSASSLLLDAAAALQRDLNGEAEFRWLGQGEAIDLILPALEVKTPSPLAEEGWGEGVLSCLKEMAAHAIGDRPLDWCVQPAASRKKRMLAADMDSTIIAQESLDVMAELAGIGPEIAAITERSTRGEADFEESLRERIRLLKGLRAADLEHALHDRITLNPGARMLVETMKANGAHTVLVSGSFTIFTHSVAARAGFAKEYANALLWENGHLEGIAGPVLGREAKRTVIAQEAARHGLSPADAIAVGDGANDIDMLTWAGLSVAYRASPAVAAAADALVKHTGLTSLLYFQGYTRDSFVS
jgi:phosphoserine phosphatase